MKKLYKVLVLLIVVTQVLVYSSGCTNNSSTGKYSRDFGNYISTTMYIDLKNDNTYETDGTAPGLFSKGTYEINGSEITFTYELDSALSLLLGYSEKTVIGTISDRRLTVEGATYVKQ
jgi:hypothetical protein